MKETSCFFSSGFHFSFSDFPFKMLVSWLTSLWNWMLLRIGKKGMKETRKRRLEIWIVWRDWGREKKSCEGVLSGFDLWTSSLSKGREKMRWGKRKERLDRWTFENWLEWFEKWRRNPSFRPLDSEFQVQQLRIAILLSVPVRRWRSRSVRKDRQL